MRVLLVHEDDDRVDPSRVVVVLDTLRVASAERRGVRRDRLGARVGVEVHLVEDEPGGESRDGAHARAPEVDDGVRGVVRGGDLVDAARAEGGVGEDEHAGWGDGVAAARRRGIARRDAPPLERRREVHGVVQEVVGDLQRDAAESAGSDPRRGRG